MPYLVRALNVLSMYVLYAVMLPNSINLNNSEPSGVIASLSAYFHSIRLNSGISSEKPSFFANRDSFCFTSLYLLCRCISKKHPRKQLSFSNPIKIAFNTINPFCFFVIILNFLCKLFCTKKCRAKLRLIKLRT